MTSSAGAARTENLAPAKNPPIDCFYVYPTVSSQPTVNANLNLDPAEIGVAQQQASQFSAACRVFAPIYPQLTLSAINRPGQIRTPAINEAYNGVLTAWQDYLAHDNHGRGVVFIGHSQGSAMLTRLIREQVDPNPAERRLLVSALLMGGNIMVPAGRDVGGDFQHVPACRSNTQIGCVVAYSTFDQPPPPNSLFGRPDQGVSRAFGGPSIANPQVLCTNPAALAGGSGELRSRFRLMPIAGPLGAVTTAVFSGQPPSGPTPWVGWDGWYNAQCVDSGGANVLEVTPTGSAPRLTPEPDPTWGLHLVDVNIALGNLVSLVQQEEIAYRH
ncbi:MAG TPA: DUF3089 domain-containing protein [Acidimicrobiales bacterium]